MGTDAGSSSEQRVIAAFAARRVQTGVTLPVLADRTGIERNRLQRLLTPGSSHPRIDEIVALCDALGLSHTELLRALWPGQPVTAGQAELSRLRRENRTLKFELAAGAERSSSSTASPTGQFLAVLRRATRWAFAYLPVFEGPSDTTVLHYANRFAVTPVDRSLADDGHRALRARFLADATALPPGVNFTVWQTGGFNRLSLPHDPYGRHALDERGPGALYLSAPVYTADRPISERPVELGHAMGRGIVVIALRQIADRLRISATLARALGWALTATDRAAQTVGASASADARDTARRLNVYANLVLGEYLTGSHPHTIISHAGTPPIDADGQPVDDHALLSTDLSAAPFIVLLSESDATLDAARTRPVNAQGGRTRFTGEQLRSWRDQLRAQVEPLARDGRALIVDIDPTWVRRTLPRDARAETQERWVDVAVVSRNILQELLHISGRQSRAALAVRDQSARELLAFESSVIWH